LRERIAAAGRAEVLANHTYTHRIQEILKVVAGERAHSNGAQSAERGAEPLRGCPGAERAEAAVIPTRSASKVEQFPAPFRDPMPKTQGPLRTNDQEAPYVPLVPAEFPMNFAGPLAAASPGFLWRRSVWQVSSSAGRAGQKKLRKVPLT
jgi:hypothetical protein